MTLEVATHIHIRDVAILWMCGWLEIKQAYKILQHIGHLCNTGVHAAVRYGTNCDCFISCYGNGNNVVYHDCDSEIANWNFKNLY